MVIALSMSYFVSFGVEANSGLHNQKKQISV